MSDAAAEGDRLRDEELERMPGFDGNSRLHIRARLEELRRRLDEVGHRALHGELSCGIGIRRIRVAARERTECGDRAGENARADHS